jgi:hypothetical protein
LVKAASAGNIKMQKKKTLHCNSKIVKDNTPVVTINIQPRPISPAQRESWRRFWKKLISEVNTKINNTDS